MQQLIEQLTTRYNINEDDAINMVNDIATYAEEKKEGLGSLLVNIINGTDEDAKNAVVLANTPAEQAAATEESFFDKAKDFVESHIPGGLKEKGEEMLNGVNDKIKGLFS